MLAYFAAQLPIQGASTKSLVDLLKDTSSRTLFPPADIRAYQRRRPAGLLFATLNVARMNQPRHTSSSGASGRAQGTMEGARL